jgi:hypothetical protein
MQGKNTRGLMSDLLLDALALLPARDLAGIAKSAGVEGQALRDSGDPWGIVLEIVGNAAEFAMVRRQLELSNV